MEIRRNLIVMLVVLVPSVLMFIADFVIGDYKLFAFINQGLANPVLDFACTYASPVLFSIFYVLTLVALYLSLNGRSKATGILSISNGILCYAVGSLIKPLVQRPRPDVLVATRVILEPRIIGLWHESAFSFPSTTMMLAFGLTLPIILEKRRIGAVLVGLSYFMGFAVIYTGFHFPLDVAAATILSSAIILCTDLVKKPLVNLLTKHKPKDSKQEK